MKGLWRTTLVAGLAIAILACGANAAAPPVSDKDNTKKGQPEIDKPLAVPAVFDKVAPEGVEDLRIIQEHVKKVVKKVMPAVVGIAVDKSSGSGVIIDEEGHVLTAGHVSGKPGQDCWVIMPDGKRLKAKTLGQNAGIDSGLIKIVDKGPFPYVGKGDSSKVKVSQWVISIGQPGGFKPTRSPVVRVGRITISNPRFLQSDCTLVGGDSGGPLFDMSGRVIGIHSRIGLTIDENVHVPVNTYTETWDRLVASESWGGLGGLFSSPRPRAYLGVEFAKGGEDLKIEAVTKDAPAEKAGFKIGDVLIGLDESKLRTRDDLFEIMGKKKPNDEVTFLVKRGDSEVKIKVKLGRRQN